MTHNFTELQEIARTRFQTTKAEQLFNSLYSSSDHDKIYYDPTCRYDELLPKYIPQIEWVKNGLTKLVIKFNDEDDWVFKIPFSGEIAWNVNQKKKVCLPYKHAEYSSNHWDHCQTEANLYNEASIYHVEDIFIETQLLTKILMPHGHDGLPIYISKCLEDATDYYVDDELIFNDANTQNISSCINTLFANYDLLDISAHFLAIIIQQYGQFYTEQLVKFLSIYEIDDLHDGNIGFTQNGLIKIIDYGSYNE